MSLTEEMVSWKEEYSIGNTEIDREHQKLFDLGKKALEITSIESENHAKAQLKEIIDELTFYVATHFANEQEFMRKIDYPDLENHTKKHKQITQDLNALICTFGTLSIMQVHEKVSEVIECTFIKHILEDDLQIKIWHTGFDEIQKNL
jgi:hemerythrin